MAKIKKFRPLKKNVPSANRLAADAQIQELYRNMKAVGAQVVNTQNLMEMYIEQLAEVNLRVRFCMEMFRYEKGATIIGLDGRPVNVEVKSMYQLYLADRERFLHALEGGGNGAAPRPDDRTEAGGAEPEAHRGPSGLVPGAGYAERDAAPRPA